MTPQPPRSTLVDTLFPYPTLFLSREDEAFAAGCGQAHEGLEALHLSAHQVDHGLVVHHDVTGVETGPQVREHPSAVEGGGPALVVEEHEAVATRLLGRVHGGVGTAPGAISAERRVGQE